MSGLDAAEGLLDVARRRTPSGDFRQGEMEELLFADGTFDVVTDFNSFQYAADPVNALRQAGRVSKPSAKVANGGQWRNLAEALIGQCEVLTPEHFGSESQGPWPGEHAFSLRNEAARTIALIEESTRPVHLVGHSYGGGLHDVALTVGPHCDGSL